MAASALAQSDFIVNGNDCLVVKRSPAAEIRPCLCPPSNEKLVDLGRGHYPRYLVTLVCEPNRCHKSAYVCSSLPYKTRVLKRREEDDDSRPDASLPQSLREEWKFVHVPVVVACVCSL
ncbi:prothoracicotropic hormone [Cimex lectularius]|uniref:Prothoracicotropic hormone n=1 Tax=Cimex lectularius TaxID=79782 RepID=A0A8I6R8V3_CIMLE|nr:prothoracicotropic hormone [Cimex lectularius]